MLCVIVVFGWCSLLASHIQQLCARHRATRYWLIQTLGWWYLYGGLPRIQNMEKCARRGLLAVSFAERKSSVCGGMGCTVYKFFFQSRINFWQKKIFSTSVNWHRKEELRLLHSDVLLLCWGWLGYLGGPLFGGMRQMMRSRLSAVAPLAHLYPCKYAAKSYSWCTRFENKNKFYLIFKIKNFVFLLRFFFFLRS